MSRELIITVMVVVVIAAGIGVIAMNPLGNQQKEGPTYTMTCVIQDNPEEIPRNKTSVTPYSELHTTWKDKVKKAINGEIVGVNSSEEDRKDFSYVKYKNKTYKCGLATG